MRLCTCIRVIGRKVQRMSIAGYAGLPDLPADRPVLIAGPTASGKSELALRIAEAQGGVVVNADASQVYDCWRVVTARPSPASPNPRTPTSSPALPLSGGGTRL